MLKQTIALVDDDRNILTSLSIALEKEGFKVQTYIDGESALIGLTSTPPALAIIDIKIPKKDEKVMIKLIEKEMTSVAQSDYHSFSTPLTVDINVGDNWGMLH